MGTGTFSEIDIRITGSINWDYANEYREPDIFLDKLRLLCAEYSLEVETMGEE